MNAISPIDKQVANSQTEAFAVEEKDDFEKEMNKRFGEMESGVVKGYTLEESTARARKSYNASK